MESRDNWDQKQVLQDPDTLARLERNLRGAGMNRRNFLAMASAVAGTAALAACGGSSSPTATTAATTAATVAPTKAPAAASAAAPTTAAASSAAPTTAASSAASGTKAPVASSAASTAAPSSTTAAGSAVAGAPAVTGPESTKVFIDGANITSEPVDNDFNRDLYCGGVAQHMSGLLRYDQDFNLVPDLAESYSNSGPVFTFKIRKGATWSDGLPIKAQ